MVRCLVMARLEHICKQEHMDLLSCTVALLIKPSVMTRKCAFSHDK